MTTILSPLRKQQLTMYNPEGHKYYSLPATSSLLSSLAEYKCEWCWMIFSEGMKVIYLLASAEYKQRKNTFFSSHIFLKELPMFRGRPKETSVVIYFAEAIFGLSIALEVACFNQSTKKNALETEIIMPSSKVEIAECEFLFGISKLFVTKMLREFLSITWWHI